MNTLRKVAARDTALAAYIGGCYLLGALTFIIGCTWSVRGKAARLPQ